MALMAVTSYAADSDTVRKPVNGGKSSQQASKSAPKARKVAKAKTVDTRPSFGRVAGLHQSGDALDLKSSVALVIDQIDDWLGHQ